MKFKKILSIIILMVVTLSFPFIQNQTTLAKSENTVKFILLSDYSKNMVIGDEYYLIAIPSTGKKPTFKSSDSKIASVNTYGKITAKKSGKVQITARINGAEATCYVSIKPTTISVSDYKSEIERGEKIQLKVTTSNKSSATFRSNRSSVATVNEKGMVVGKKPGEAIITIKADDTIITKTIIVCQPTVKLNTESISLFRREKAKIVPTISSTAKATYRSNKKSVAVVDENGSVTAIKNGTAIITVKVDGVEKLCEVEVKKPDISLNVMDLSLSMGETYKMEATVSSKNKVTWSTSNQNVLNIDSTGKITPLKKGKAYVYASEDGTKVRCQVKITD